MQDTNNASSIPTYVPMGTILPFALATVNIPAGWLLCDGSDIPGQYKDLMKALGSPKTPNLSGLTLIGAGKACSGTIYSLNETGGTESITLSVDQMPAHSHSYNYKDPIGQEGSNFYSGSYWEPTTVTADTANTGSSQPHSNMQPFYTLNFIIYTGQNN